MKIAVVSSFYSQGMGYVENCLPKALAALGHDVHVLTSPLNVYGNAPEYDSTYREFLGPADQGTGTLKVDGYTVHRLPSRMLGGYVLITGLASAIRAIRPDVVHSLEIASVQTFQLALLKATQRFKLFTETHQHLSVVKPFLKKESGDVLRKAAYRVTRTLPTYLASLAVERCYAIAPDCVYVANEFYGVPHEKLKLQSLGTDTDLFRPPISPEELEKRAAQRRARGYSESDVVCIYTGRFSVDKNPLALARAVALLSSQQPGFHGLFIGEGGQRADILSCPNATVSSFVKYAELADVYRLADIAVWPRQESMSMLDAAACGLPLVVSNAIGESERVTGNGAVYEENDVDDLARALLDLASPERRKTLGAAGRAKMVDGFSWALIARAIEADYEAAMRRA